MNRQHRQHVTEELYITWLKLHYFSSREFRKWGAVGHRWAHNTPQKSWCPVLAGYHGECPYNCLVI